MIFHSFHIKVWLKHVPLGAVVREVALPLNPSLGARTMRRNGGKSGMPETFLDDGSWAIMRDTHAEVAGRQSAADCYGGYEGQSSLRHVA